MAKSNDEIPADEMLLAEAIAAARARGLRWCKGNPFARDEHGAPASREEATHCCALGALDYAGRVDMDGSECFPAKNLTGIALNAVVNGNDASPSERWLGFAGDDGESLGYAYRCAMTESP